jgi:hypothetical protein
MSCGGSRQSSNLIGKLPRPHLRPPITLPRVAPGHGKRVWSGFFFCRRAPSPIHLFAEVFKPKDGTSRLNRVPPTFLKPKGPPRSQLLHRNCRHVFPFLLPSSCPFPRPIQSSKQRRTKALSTGASDLAGSLDYVLKYLLSTYLGRYLSRYQRKAVGSFDFDTRIFGAWN